MRVKGGRAAAGAVLMLVLSLILVTMMLVTTAPRSTSAAPPAQGVSMTLVRPASGSLSLGSLDPQIPSDFPGALSIYVEAFKTSYRLSYSAQDFSFSGSRMPIGVMSYVLRYGGMTEPRAPFEAREVLLDADSKGRTKTTYDFDLSIDVPLDYQPGMYTTAIVFTVVPL